jgi:hypothetical protein
MFWVRTDWKTPKLRPYVFDPILGLDILPAPSQPLRAFMEERVPQVVRCGPSLVSTYLLLLSEQMANDYWHLVLNVVASLTARDALDWLDGFNKANVPRNLRPSPDFEGFVKETIIAVLEDGRIDLKRVLSLLVRSG